MADDFSIWRDRRKAMLYVKTDIQTDTQTDIVLHRSFSLFFMCLRARQESTDRMNPIKLPFIHQKFALQMPGVLPKPYQKSRKSVWKRVRSIIQPKLYQSTVLSKFPILGLEHSRSGRKLVQRSLDARKTARTIVRRHQIQHVKSSMRFKKRSFCKRVSDPC